MEVLSRNKITPEAVIDPVAQNLEAAGHWRRASTRWLLVMGDFECTEAQREWLRTMPLQNGRMTMNHFIIEIWFGDNLDDHF
ncbi:PerC family transcriptional regulator [Salmonella enterica]|nr:PerC family transcriptional regulator [Salmonella enterica]